MRIILFFLIGIPFAHICFAGTTNHLYAIPERREFPTNMSINPCVDFHKYVCSIAEEKFKLRPDRSIHSFAFSDSRERILEYKKKFLKNIKNENNLSDRANQIKDNYLACMNTSERKKAEKILVQSFTQEIQKIKTTSELIDWTWGQTENGKASLFHLFEYNNPDNPRKLDVALYTSALQLPDKKYYTDEKILADYKKILVQFFHLIDPKTSKAEVEKRASELLNFETSAAKIFPDSAVRRQRWSERRQLSQTDFNKMYPLLKMEKYFNQLPKEALVFHPLPEGLEAFYKLIQENNLQTLKDAMTYDFLSEWMDEAYPNFFKMRFNLNKKYFGGPVKRADLQERCTNRVTSDFLKETDQILIEKLFPNFDEGKVIKLGQKIRSSILAGIEKNQWLSPDSRKEALAKIQKAKLYLVRPQNDREWDFHPIQKYSAKNIITNQFLFRKTKYEDILKRLHEPANLEKWDMGPLTVNAYYSPEENKFVLPMGILQYPFYDGAQSLSENLAAIGAVMGHELGHSIDDQGSKYDSDGHLRQWMNMKDLAEFSQRGARLVEQFNQADHDGKLTLGENVADLVGLTFAYNAAFPNDSGSLEDKKKFFTSYARSWCVVVRPDFVSVLKKTDPHSLGWARINEQVKHQSGFQEAFSCKPNDPLFLPEKDRIKIW